ncbi:hypothetical protein UAW_00863 [Enterococcus haemoperoxidus ATCC BAA-382]|uniref:Uncharacterized protein n=1 Tax=Enterococcus haemoperoxidus ATCC BAA-382 TaxID=1158608 RepID=R2SWV4_9ENTE|nr:hypothetical protein UAW_00863 [Enterococcus haemoperoxidus ATCC BAA-382]EOT62550.1 hypothetical protein I583_01550 [Enterococcus haemoperoxidus ATCC BAA-382]
MDDSSQMIKDLWIEKSVEETKYYCLFVSRVIK